MTTEHKPHNHPVGAGESRRPPGHSAPAPDSKQHKRPVTSEGVALLIEDCEKTSATLSMRPTPFQLEQAVNLLVSTVPAALRNLEEQLQSAQTEIINLKLANDGWYEDAVREVEESKRLTQNLKDCNERARVLAETCVIVQDERDGLKEQLETAQRDLASEREQLNASEAARRTAQSILVEERRWIGDARDWYRDHRSSKGGIYDEGTWGDPFAVPGEAGVSASSDSVGRAERPATPPVSSPVSSPARESS